MNSTQTQTTAATLIGIIAGFLAGKGVFGFDSATWATILGSIVAAGMAAWTALATRKAALITTTAQLPEVQSVKLEPSASKAMMDATPNNVTK